MERGDASDAERTALDLIRDTREIEPSQVVAAKLDELERVLQASAQKGDAGREPKPRRQFGAFAGKFSIGPEFFEPMTNRDRLAWHDT